MNATPIAEIEHECTRLVARFALYVDHRRYEALLDLFTHDGEFARPGMSARGRDAMSAWLASRPANVITRHICSPTVFEEIVESEARSVTYVTVYQCEDSGKEIQPMDTPAALVEYHDLFRKTGNGWRIALRTVQPVMARGV